jgi:hypothetical protein
MFISCTEMCNTKLRLENFRMKGKLQLIPVKICVQRMTAGLPRVGTRSSMIAVLLSVSLTSRSSGI